MTSTVAKRRWLALLTYPLAGLVLGLVDPAFHQAVGQLGIKPGLATAATVNVLLPLVALALGAVYPRVWSACLGALAMTLGLLVGLAVCYNPPLVAPKPWGLLLAVPPVLVAACVGYAVLGTVAAVVSRRREMQRSNEEETVLE
jgi:hypothetical protein